MISRGLETRNQLNSNCRKPKSFSCWQRRQRRKTLERCKWNTRLVYQGLTPSDWQIATPRRRSKSHRKVALHVTLNDRWESLTKENGLAPLRRHTTACPAWNAELRQSDCLPVATTTERLKQGFPTWGTCTLRGTYTYLKR